MGDAAGGEPMPTIGTQLRCNERDGRQELASCSAAIGVQAALPRKANLGPDGSPFSPKSVQPRAVR
jgi:hypothetical protein